MRGPHKVDFAIPARWRWIVGEVNEHRIRLARAKASLSSSAEPLD